MIKVRMPDGNVQEFENMEAVRAFAAKGGVPEQGLVGKATDFVREAATMIPFADELTGSVRALLGQAGVPGFEDVSMAEGRAQERQRVKEGAERLGP